MTPSIPLQFHYSPLLSSSTPHQSIHQFQHSLCDRIQIFFQILFSSSPPFLRLKSFRIFSNAPLLPQPWPHNCLNSISKFNLQILTIEPGSAQARSSSVVHFLFYLLISHDQNCRKMRRETTYLPQLLPPPLSPATTDHPAHAAARSRIVYTRP